VAIDPFTADEPGEDGAVNAARRAEINVFHACSLPAKACENSTPTSSLLTTHPFTESITHIGRTGLPTII
jgi:hypothetical protein